MMNSEPSKHLQASMCPDWQVGFERSCACLPNEGVWFLNSDAIQEAGASARLRTEWVESLCQTADTLGADRSCVEMLWHWHRGLIDPGGWTVDDMEAWPHAQGPVLAGAYALLVLSGVKNICRAMQGRGVPGEVIADTLRDVSRAIQGCVDKHGCVGITRLRWLTHHLTLRLVELGRLQYEMGFVRTKLDVDEQALMKTSAGLLQGHGLCLESPVLWLHIPKAGPITAERCEESLKKAQSFFAKYYPEHPYQAMLCRSWLLDSQLKAYLPTKSNILAFQDRFEPIALDRPTDEIQRFVYGQVYGDLGQAPQTNRLEKAIVQHLLDGGQWRTVLGIIKS